MQTFFLVSTTRSITFLHILGPATNFEADSVMLNASTVEEAAKKCDQNVI